MARKARQRISYGGTWTPPISTAHTPYRSPEQTLTIIVLPLDNSPGGHRLGVNGLAVDGDQSILYSGGRDGLICAWDLNVKLSHDRPSRQDPSLSKPELPFKTGSISASSSRFRTQVQAHTHWVNDVVLTKHNSTLVSASSDITIKAWRPHAESKHVPVTIGIHNDYAKCLASPGQGADWVASGGLDRKIRLWDLSGGGETLQIDVGQDESGAKGSVYALSARSSVMASGGPESIIRIWDPKTGKRITNFVGHTDNIRDILINQSGDMVMTGSSDQTVKLWSLTAGRCMSTLTMHNDSVWSLYADHPNLSVFYSSDRSGLVAKTDMRGSSGTDSAVCVALAQEQEGIHKVVTFGHHFWTATSSSSINRWKDVDIATANMIPQSPANRLNASPVLASNDSPSTIPGQALKETLFRSNKGQSRSTSVLRATNAPLSSPARPRDADAGPQVSGSRRRTSEMNHEEEIEHICPYHDLPEETIEGQHGLIKHTILNDRRRVLTLDTAGEVVMWDLLKCVPIQNFGKRHLDEVAPEVNTTESVAHWCNVDTRTGMLAVVLEENHCFDAEVYADELWVDDALGFREDQRINLGKWILRYLFDGLIDEEMKRDEEYRTNIRNNNSFPSQPNNSFRRTNAPPWIQLPESQMQRQQNGEIHEDNVITPRANGYHIPIMTPGLSIAVATPAIGPTNHTLHLQNSLSTTVEHGNLEKGSSQSSQPRTSMERTKDYFTPAASVHSPTTPGKLPVSPESETMPQSPTDSKESGSLFGKKFRMNMTFPKKLGRSSVEVRSPVLDEKAEESDKSEDKEDKQLEDNLLGIVQQIRYGYDEQLYHNPNQPPISGIQPSLPSETPVLQLPPRTTVIIQEDRPDSGGVADLYRGTVASVGQDADLIEKTAPMWLGDLLLRGQIPNKEISKVSFILQPYQDLLPSIASPDGNARLNANRMLRAKKILVYVSERIEPGQPTLVKGEELFDVLRPEEYLELSCQGQVVPPSMTLATLRAYVWKTGGDVVLYYRSNGRKPGLDKLLRVEAEQGREADVIQQGLGQLLGR